MNGAVGVSGYTPVLGLSDEPGQQVAVSEQRNWRVGTVFDQPEPEDLIELTVIVPARNEQDCLGECLRSLVNQSEEIFELGKDWEIVVVDDHSTDRTPQIAGEFARGNTGVSVLQAGKLEKGWTGKANAIWTAARKARGRWLLFTDADTIHEPGDLRRAIHEASRHKVGMLSYSPRQIVAGLAQRSLMPLVFCELALAVWRALDILLLVGLPVLTVELWNAHFAAHSAQWLAAGWVLALLWIRTLFRFYARVAKSNFPFVDCALAPLGLPLFVVLLYRSWFQHRILKRVSWKGREYAG